MAETSKARGTVTPISSEYSPEETHTAAKLVEDAIAGKQQELERLRGYISDNANLINLVQRLPDQLNHSIMVPFGKAAFFPGRLVHTNEFLVLLGEGYYVETTSKQTVEILKRRAKSLDSQLNSLNAVVQDLQAEASFFRSTASEIAEGILEIREEYVEDSSVGGESESESESGPLKQVPSISSEEDKEKGSVDDDEFSRIMSRLDELEKEEREAEMNSESDEDEQTEADLEGPSKEMSHLEIEHTEKPDSEKPWEQKKDIDAISGEIINNQKHRSDFTDECTGLTANPIPTDTEEPQSVSETLGYKTKKSVAKNAAPAAVEKEVQPFPSLSQQPEQAPIRTSGVGFDSQKAFTGSIVERPENLETASRKHTSSQTSSSQSSKPVSRFKMLRK